MPQLRPWAACRDLSIPVTASALLLAHLLLALALIPPWQQPDEPTFVAQAELWRNRIKQRDDGPDPGREREILQSMAAYSWWQHRRSGGIPPVTLPEDFGVTGAGTPAATPGRPPGYPWLASGILSWFPPSTVVEDLYLLRVISAVFGVLTLWAGWLGARECLGTFGGATVAVMLALHPQFSIVSTAATSDAAANMLAACAWWQVAAAIRRSNVLFHLAAAWCASIAAAVTDRMAVPLVVMVAIASVVAVLLRWRARGVGLLVTSSAAAVLVAAILDVTTWVSSFLGKAFQSFEWSRLFSLRVAPEAMSWDVFTKFTTFVHQSWWFSLGWGRYPLPAVWALIVVVITAVATAGIAWGIFKGRTLDTRTRVLMALAVTGVVAQVAAVYWMYFRVDIGSQGKSLFPVLIPSLVLLWAGLEIWVPPPHRARAAAALVFVLVLLDISVWMAVAIPAYH